MREGLKGVSTARYFKSSGKLNKRDTVFTTMATVAQRGEQGHFYTYFHHVHQLLKEQQILRHVDPHAFAQVFRDCKHLGQIEHVDEGLWVWHTDPRPFSALEADHDEWRAEIHDDERKE